jgi:peptide/nickel transport system substrate-binding protein
MNRCRMALLLVGAVLALGWAHGVGAQTKPAGELVWAMHVTIAPAWFDPAEQGGLITPFIALDTIASLSVLSPSSHLHGRA